MPTKRAEAQNDVIIPRAAQRASQFLGVIQKACEDEGLGISLQPCRRSFRDESIVLRAPIKAGRGNNLELEVFADPQGNALHVGWQANRTEVGGGAFTSFGLLGEINAATNWTNQRNANKAGNQRALSGILQAFDGLVFQPVVQQLLEAVQVERTKQNGFLGT